MQEMQETQIRSLSQEDPLEKEYMFTSAVWDTLLSADPTGKELMRTGKDKQFSPLKPWQLCQSFLNKSTRCWFNELVLKEDSGLQYCIYSVSGDLNTH